MCNVIYYEDRLSYIKKDECNNFWCNNDLGPTAKFDRVELYMCLQITYTIL